VGGLRLRADLLLTDPWARSCIGGMRWPHDERSR
jgi:hypothetical protein